MKKILWFIGCLLAASAIQGQEHARSKGRTTRQDPGPVVEALLIKSYLAQSEVMKKAMEDTYSVLLPDGGLALPVWDQQLGTMIKSKTMEENARLLVSHILDLVKNKKIDSDVLATWLNQQDIKEKKRRVGVLRDLHLADTDWVFSMAEALGIPENILHLSPILQQMYDQPQETFRQAKVLFGTLHVLDSDTPIPLSLRDLDHEGQRAMLHRAVLGELVLQRKRQLSLLYAQLAGRKLAIAEDVATRVDLDGYFEMTEAQRLQVYDLINAYQLEATALKHQADQLLRESIGENHPKHHAVATYYRNNKIHGLTQTMTTK